MKKTIIYIVSIIFIAWLAFSFIDIVSDNNSREPQHADVNAFVLITKDREKQTTVQEIESYTIGMEVLSVSEYAIHAEGMDAGTNHTQTFTLYHDEVYAVGDVVEVEVREMCSSTGATWYEYTLMGLHE
jgi:hypothetical protein